MLAAVTLIVAFPPMVPPLIEFAIVKPRLPPVEMLFAVTFTVAFAPIVPTPPPLLLSIESRVATGSEIASEIEVEVGAPADGASDVVDRGIKSADR